MVIFCLANGLLSHSTPVFYLMGGVCAFFAAVLLFADLGLGAKIQVGLLFLLGISLMLYAHYRGVSISLVEAIARNTFLLTMLMSVGFLKLLLDTEVDKQALPRGRQAFLKTLLSLGFFGSVINLSAPVMICDRIAEEQPVDHFIAGVTTRIFCLCSCWSPYFAGAAFVLTYVPGVKLWQIMLTGLPLLILGIALVYIQSSLNHRERVEKFVGYPVSAQKLWLPVALSICVILTKLVFPHLSILVVISLSCLLLTMASLLIKLGVRISVKRLIGHINQGLPKSSNELLLFLAAGVLATGLGAYIQTTGYQLTITDFEWRNAALLLGGMIIIAAIGLHPIILISALTPILLPISPDPELLAITYLFAWALGTAASPLSGTHMVIQGRYGIPAWQSAVQNWPYVATMYLAALGLMAIHTQLSGI